MTKKEFRQKLVSFFDTKEIDFENSNSTKTLWNWAVKNHDVLNNTDLTQEIFEETFAATPEPPEIKSPEETENVSLPDQLKAFNESQANQEETPIIEFKPKARGKKPKDENFTPAEEILQKENKPTPQEPEKDNTFLWVLVALAAIILYFYLKNRNTVEYEENE